jgi:hypothetical protein
MDKVTQISKEDMAPVLESRAKALDAAGAAERALKDARLAELEFKVQIQQLFLSKGLDPNCKLDTTTGNVAWPEEGTEPAAQQTELVEPPEITKKRRGKGASKENG